MPDFTPGGIPFPLVDDKIKDGTSPSALVEDLKTLALGADAHAHSTADTAKTDAIADATTKYGGLPPRVAAIETKNITQDAAIGNAKISAVGESKEYTDQVVNTSHLALDIDGTPFFSPGSMTYRIFMDTDGNPYFREI